jgi:hypothetical protein
MIDYNYGAVGGMRTGKGNRNTRRKPAPVPLFPPQISHDLSWDRTRAAAVERHLRGYIKLIYIYIVSISTFLN